MKVAWTTTDKTALGVSKDCSFLKLNRQLALNKRVRSSAAFFTCTFTKINILLNLIHAKAERNL